MYPQEHLLLKKVKPGKAIAKSSRSVKAKFPVDFFEHCQITNEIEFGGSDLLEIYNVNQIKTRLNTNGMYIANSKVKCLVYTRYFNPNRGCYVAKPP